MPVGAPGGPHRSRHGRGNTAKAAAYRHSEKGMMARRMRLMNPEVRARIKARRDAHRKMKAGF